MIRLIPILFALLIVGCHNAPQESFGFGKQSRDVSAASDDVMYDALAFDEEELQFEQSPPPNPQAEKTPEFSLDIGSKIIKNGNISFEVDDLESSREKVDFIIQNSGSIVANEVFTEYSNRVSYSLTIRIPGKRFESIVSQLEAGMGTMKSKHIDAQDVSEEYVDLKIRLKNNLAYLDQYKVILQKAKTIKEILEIQEIIRRVEEEIESKKGRLKYLDDRVRYSTLNLVISELITTEIAGAPKFTIQLTNAFNNGATSF